MVNESRGLNLSRRNAGPMKAAFSKYSDDEMKKVLKIIGPTKNGQQGIAAIKKALKVDDKKAEDMLDAAIKYSLGESKEMKDLNTKNVDKALAHDCAKHVVHEKWGEGKCIPEMHSLEEGEDGTGFVTHYDVMFEHGVEQNVPVEDLEIVVSESHMHSKKKMKEEFDNGDEVEGGDEEPQMDPVNKKALKKKFKDRKDKDIDNDGDVDDSDKYLHMRRKAVSKALDKKNN